MSIFKRGDVYWFHFIFDGQHIQKSTKQGNARTASQIEAAYKTKLAKGEVGIVERKKPPLMKEFAQRFIDFVQVRSAEKPSTISYYAEKLRRLLEYPPLVNSRLDRIDEALIEEYVQSRHKKVSPASINRELAVLRRALRLAQEWKLIDKVPHIKMLPGEKPRNFVLSDEQEQVYLDHAPQPLHDIAILTLETGLRVGEACNLEWRDIRGGMLRVREGKSDNAPRILPLTPRVKQMLTNREAEATSPYIFPGKGGKPFRISSLDHQHRKLRTILQFPREFVIHSLRHTMLTRLGDKDVEAFTIQKIAGHADVKTTQRYVHTGAAAVEAAFKKLEARNGEKNQIQQLPATVSATPSESESVSHCAPVAQVDRATVS